MQNHRLALLATITGLLGTPSIMAEPSRIQFSSASFEINELDGRPLLSLVCEPHVTNQTRVVIKATGGSAQWPADYLPNEIEVQISAGFAAWDFDSLTVLDDGLTESDETVELTIVSVDGGSVLGARTNATLLIRNGSPRVDIEKNFLYNSYRQENESFAFTAVRTGDTNVAIAFDIMTTTNGSAIPAIDFVSVNERCVFQPGETRKDIVPLLDDGKVEPAKTIELVLSNPSDGTTLSVTNVTAVIYDDEIPANLDLGFAPEFSRWPWAGQAWDGENQLAVQSDGKIIVTGGALFRGGKHVPMIRLHRDGRPDASFQMDLHCKVDSIALAPDGKILVAGRKPIANEIPELGGPFIARLLPTGAVDASFLASADWNGPAPQMLVQNNGGVILYGAAIYGLLRLHPSGSIDRDFESNLPRLGFIKQGAFHLGDKLLLNSQFHIRGWIFDALVRVNSDGTSDPAFAGPFSWPSSWPPAPTNLVIRQSLVLADGRIMVQAQDDGFLWGRQRFVRLFPNGDIDPSFSDTRLIPGLTFQYSHSQWEERMLAEVDGYLYFVPGESGPAGPGLARLRPDGSLDTSFAAIWSHSITCGTLTYGGPRREIPKAVFHDGALLSLNSEYSRVNGASRTLARILLKGSPQTAFVFQAESVSAQERGFASYEALGEFQIRILRQGDRSVPCSLQFATGDGTAQVGKSYIHTTTNLVFAPMENEKVITVPILQDSIFQGRPDFLIGLANPSIPAALDPPTRVYIYDREPGVVNIELLSFPDRSDLRFEFTGPDPQRGSQTNCVLEGSEDLKTWTLINGYGVEGGCRPFGVPRNARPYLSLEPNQTAQFLRLRAGAVQPHPTP